MAAVVAEAIDRQVHADLADAAERREYELLLAGHQRAPVGCVMANTSPAAIVSVAFPGVAISNRPSASMPSKVPVSCRFGSRTMMVSPRLAARASQSLRIDAKPAPAAHCAMRAFIAAASFANRSGASIEMPFALRSVAP